MKLLPQVQVRLPYDYLIPVPGFIIGAELLTWDCQRLWIKELFVQLHNPEHYWEVLQNFKGGNAVLPSLTLHQSNADVSSKICNWFARGVFSRKQPGLREKDYVLYCHSGPQNPRLLFESSWFCKEHWTKINPWFEYYLQTILQHRLKWDGEKNRRITFFSNIF